MEASVEVGGSEERKIDVCSSQQDLSCVKWKGRTIDWSSGGARPFNIAWPARILFATGSFRP